MHTRRCSLWPDAGICCPSLPQNLKLLGGEAGLSRPMTWVYSILSQPFSNWVNFGDLIFYNAAGRDTSEVMLLRAVSEADDCGLAGIIFLLDQDLLPSLPDSVGREGTTCLSRYSRLPSQKTSIISPATSLLTSSNQTTRFTGRPLSGRRFCLTRLRRAIRHYLQKPI